MAEGAAYRGWKLEVEPYEDGDGFWTDDYFAVKDGVRQHLHHSRWGFYPTPRRFAWLVDSNFPRHPKGWNWKNDSIDEAILQDKIEKRDLNMGTTPLSSIVGKPVILRPPTQAEVDMKNGFERLDSLAIELDGKVVGMVEVMDLFDEHGNYFTLDIGIPKEADG